MRRWRPCEMGLNQIQIIISHLQKALITKFYVKSLKSRQNNENKIITLTPCISFSVHFQAEQAGFNRYIFALLLCVSLLSGQPV